MRYLHAPQDCRGIVGLTRCGPGKLSFLGHRCSSCDGGGNEDECADVSHSSPPAMCWFRQYVITCGERQPATVEAATITVTHIGTYAVLSGVAGPIAYTSPSGIPAARLAPRRRDGAPLYPPPLKCRCCRLPVSV